VQGGRDMMLQGNELKEKMFQGGNELKEKMTKQL
jgi:hypothetical protein